MESMPQRREKIRKSAIRSARALRRVAVRRRCDEGIVDASIITVVFGGSVLSFVRLVNVSEEVREVYKAFSIISRAVFCSRRMETDVNSAEVSRDE
jgi:hypothetical protein